MIRFAGPSLESGYEHAGLLLVNADPLDDITLIADPDKGSVLIMIPRATSAASTSRSARTTVRWTGRPAIIAPLPSCWPACRKQ
jgi:hypothetical protein